MRTRDDFRVKPTKLNLIHNRIRIADFVGEFAYRDSYYKEYIKAGGKRSLAKLLATPPARADKGRGV